MKKKDAKKQMEYSDIIEAILGSAEACNLAGHDAQIVTGDAGLAKILVKGFCDAHTDNVDVIFTDSACAEEFTAEEPQTEEVEAVPVAETEEVEAVEAVAVEE